MKKKVLFVKVRDVETGKFWSTRSRDFTKVGHFYRCLGTAKNAMSRIRYRWGDRNKVEFVVFYDTGYVEILNENQEKENIGKMSFNKAVDISSIEMKKVESSQIKEMGCKDGVMLVEFHGGSRYLYTTVDDDTFKAVLTADSVGSEFNRRVKSHKEIVCVKVG